MHHEEMKGESHFLLYCLYPYFRHCNYLKVSIFHDLAPQNPELFWWMDNKKLEWIQNLFYLSSMQAYKGVLAFAPTNCCMIKFEKEGNMDYYFIVTLVSLLEYISMLDSGLWWKCDNVSYIVIVFEQRFVESFVNAWAPFWIQFILIWFVTLSHAGWAYLYAWHHNVGHVKPKTHKTWNCKFYRRQPEIASNCRD